MHRAVAARLSNPDLSLFEALRLGGFDYPSNDDASVMDSEHVTLGQRKNQLSRRLRLARKNPSSYGHDNHSQHSGSPTFSATSNPHGGVTSGRLSNEAQEELEKMMHHSRHVGKMDSAAVSKNNNQAPRSHLKRDVSDLGLSDEEVDADAATMELQQQQEDPKRARMAKFHPDYAPLFVAPSSSVRNSFSHVTAQGGANASSKSPSVTPQHHFQQQQQQVSAFTPGGGLGGAGGMPSLPIGTGAFGPSLGGASGAFQPTSSFFSQSMAMFPTSQNQHARPSSVAIASLSATAQAVGMTLEQLAVALGSSPTNLAKLLAESSSADAMVKKQELALNLYQTESRALYSKCMLMAGIDPKHCQETSPAYLQFALTAWQQEGRRLHDLMGHSRVGEAPLTFDTAPTIKRQPKRSSASSVASSSSRSSRGAAAPSAEDGRKNHDHHSHLHSRHDHGHSHSHQDEEKSEEGSRHGCGDGRHVHRLEGKCGHKAIIHQPKDGTAHIDFVIGSKVECYHGIEPLGKNSNSVWPSRYRCEDLDGSCSNLCERDSSRVTGAVARDPKDTNVQPKTIQLSEINLADPEWNVDLNGSIDGTLVGLFKLGERGDDSLVASL